MNNKLVALALTGFMTVGVAGLAHAPSMDPVKYKPTKQEIERIDKNTYLDPAFEKSAEEMKRVAYEVELTNKKATANTEKQKLFKEDPLYREVSRVYNDMQDKLGYKFPSYLTPELFRAEVTAESTGVVNAVSSADAKGLIQVTEMAARALKISKTRYEETVYHPYDNLNMGLSYALHANEMLSEFYPNWNELSNLQKAILVLGSYNGGYGAEIEYAKENIKSPIYESLMYPWRVLGAFKRIAPDNLQLFLLENSPDHNTEAWEDFAPIPGKPLEDYIPPNEVASTIGNYLRTVSF